MKRRIGLGTLTGLLIFASAQAATPPPTRSPDRTGGEITSESQGSSVSLDSASAEIRTLLSSIDMTVSLIDAYGQCRDEGKDHEQCMSIIRETLEHARGLIGR